MTPLPAKYRDTVDNCTRCVDPTTVPPTDLGSDPDGRNVVLIYTCTAGHAWTRTLHRADLKHHPAKASAGTRRHLADRTPVTTTTITTTTTTTGNDDHEDEANMTSKTARQPSPRTWFHPDRRLWVPR